MKSSKRQFFILLCFSLASAFVGCGGADDESQALSAVLTGDQEAPQPVATGAIGSASFILNRTTGLLTGSVTVDGMTPTVAHIHVGAAGTAGAVVVPLSVDGAGVVSVPRTLLTTDQIAKLDAGQLYVNIHSTAAPAGEIRGQIGREVFTSRLNGAQEAVPVTTAAQGVGRVVLNPANRTISGEIEVTGAAGTAAHIHAGTVGVNGPILVSLLDRGDHNHFVVPENTLLTEAQAEALRNGGLYFNVHSAAAPAGEVRGQIGRVVLAANAVGTQEVPPTASNGKARGLVSLNPATREVEGWLTVSGVARTVAHVHRAPAGSNGPVVVAFGPSADPSAAWTLPANTLFSASDVAALLTQGLYVNVHSTSFPSGEVRGQLVP